MDVFQITAEQGKWTITPSVEVVVSRCVIDYAFTIDILENNESLSVRFGNKFELTTPFESKLLSVDDTMALGAGLILFNKSLLNIDVYENGILKIAFSDNVRVEAAPNESFEAWEIYSSFGARFICLSGGR